ncbi:MAG TPA: hypothetical protein VG389_13365 [Myxococcota bacterium]|jgi:hypothetical protein|nr:hypothetical protein [Myxococcota bacterium]
MMRLHPPLGRSATTAGAAAAAALAALLLSGAHCGPEQVVLLEISDSFDPATPFSALPASGATMELRQGLQGAVMVAPGLRVTGVDGATSGRVVVTAILDGVEIADADVPLTELARPGDGAAYDYGLFNPLPDGDITAYIGRTATIRAEVIGGGFAGETSIDVMLVDNETDF